MNILFHKHFRKSYEKLPSKIKEQFKKRLDIFAEDQFNFILNNHALHGEWQAFRSINITNDFRALYQSLDRNLVEFFIIDTHSNLY